MKARVGDIDWDRVRRHMAKVIRGVTLSPEEVCYVVHALRADRERYRRTHAEEKAEATAEINPLAKRRDR